MVTFASVGICMASMTMFLIVSVTRFVQVMIDTRVVVCGETKSMTQVNLKEKIETIIIKIFML